ncbi:YdaS family helix-turn-helix protein [Acetobacter indonesiensis]|uniref:transcriptional regulator n=1 Tax=Acetobacter indonesiensis TaxID=104101 RepID=UPI001F3EFB06|nr:YdaS family helix-turn-helix protein [Acetobacter indonesiensis]MCG0995310.1 YdaS family helix-turn-helix protein [Acetobacter indonesiensis]
MTTIRDVIDAMGGTRKAARMLDVPPSTVQSWKAKGCIPATRVLAVEAASGIARHLIRPDIFGGTKCANTSEEAA